MRILVANNHLQQSGGSENYTYALAMELKRLGHDVEYFTFHKGEISDILEKEGVPFMSKSRYSLILANHCTCVETLRKKGYVIQTCHGIYPALEQPSDYADFHVSITEEVRQHLSEKGYESEIIMNGIDCNRFSSVRQISEKLSSVLSLCQSDELNKFIAECCASINVSFSSCNKFTDNVWDLCERINEADLVIGIGRSLYDAMACGRAVISYDMRSYVGIDAAIGDGYITADNIEASIARNCSGRVFQKTFTRDELIAELLKYDKKDGEWARNYALKHLNISVAASRYISIYYSKVNPLRLWFEKKFL